ncbi:phenylalanine 4-monooxygenase [Thalassotalea sediminis]|uniref:phenylalanine 4-monooxygenase n=1 Tax=Thalassotalea sediminis TaxID=1759089 RepID=UPI002573E70F|nr:phenylalanine 4-monooxygenase [Thalassotalea sediminis]
MAKNSAYVSRQPDAKGFIDWSDEENSVWHELITRQLSCIEGTACDEYIAGLEKLNLPTDRIPQLGEISEVLMAETGWQCEPVPALIGFGEFFRLLSEKKFPVATFIRTREEFDYLQEPDIFHEIFGHCPLLTNPSFASYTQAYGKMGLNATKEQRVFLARLYWFTVEFGLLDTPEGLRVYGGGIISSPTETQYALHDENAIRKPLSYDNVIDVLRTPYRIDILQPIYYMLTKVSDLDEIRKYEIDEIFELVEQAKSLGLFEARFPPKEEKQAS